jgi:hypothetical protein
MTSRRAPSKLRWLRGHATDDATIRRCRFEALGAKGSARLLPAYAPPPGAPRERARPSVRTGQAAMCLQEDHTLGARLGVVATNAAEPQPAGAARSSVRGGPALGVLSFLAG